MLMSFDVTTLGSDDDIKMKITTKKLEFGANTTVDMWDFTFFIYSQKSLIRTFSYSNMSVIRMHLAKPHPLFAATFVGRYWVFQGSLYLFYSSWRHRITYGQGRLCNKGESNCQTQPLGTASLLHEMKTEQRLTVLCIVALTQCLVHSLADPSSQEMHRTRSQQDVSSSGLALQLTLWRVSVMWANIIWTPSVMLQLFEHFSYPNTLRSQHVQMSDLRL